MQDKGKNNEYRYNLYLIYMDKYDKMTNINHVYLCKMNTLLYIC